MAAGFRTSRSIQNRDESAPRCTQPARTARSGAIFLCCQPANRVHCDLSRLSEMGLIDRVLATGQEAGYRFSLTSCTTDAAGTVVGYRANAVPMNSQLGSLLLCSDESQTIWYTKLIESTSCFERKYTWTKRDYLALSKHPSRGWPELRSHCWQDTRTGLRFPMRPRSHSPHRSRPDSAP